MKRKHILKGTGLIFNKGDEMTAEELFKNNIDYTDAQLEKSYMSLFKFRKALIEHDKEIISKIEEMIKEGLSIE